MTANWLKELNLKPRSGSVKTFKSYVDLEQDTPAEEKLKEEVGYTYIFVNFISSLLNMNTRGLNRFRVT